MSSHVRRALFALLASFIFMPGVALAQHAPLIPTPERLLFVDPELVHFAAELTRQGHAPKPRARHVSAAPLGASAQGASPAPPDAPVLESELGERLEGFWYQLGRKVTFGTMAAMNSEALFTNLPPSGALGASALIYIPSFILMDELIQRYDMDGLSVFYLGALYGLWLEGLLLGQVHESPGFFITYITTFWHGLLTTYSAHETTEILFDRREGRRFQKGWLIAGSVATGLVTAAFFSTFGVNQWTTDARGSAAVLLASGGVTYLLIRQVKKKRGYVSRPLLAASLIATGFALGFAHQALLIEENQGVENPAEIPYTRNQHAQRAAFYVSVELSLLWRAFVAK